MALKVKNPRKNLADILIEKERLNESYDSSSAVSLKTLEETAEEEGAVEHVLPASKETEKKQEKDKNRPDESIVNEPEQIAEKSEKITDTIQSNKPQTPNPVPTTEMTGITEDQQIQQPQQNMAAYAGQINTPVQAETVQQEAGLTKPFDIHKFDL